ncbi:helicase-related protein [Luedemannella flava]|uniref:helicase-related protein n=1 Tax=Luedemannella flava TaxID=349316 RepID=UPI0031E44F04
MTGIVPGEPVMIVAVNWHGSDAVEVTYRTDSGQLRDRLIFRSEEESLQLATTAARPFDADAADFKLAAEAQRIRLAGIYDPMLAVTTSDVRPLPHQIRAVYGELLPRTPLRFLLADDPGAGKTIMAGLYIKELLLREDVHRCLVVAPGGLVEQWQDELYFKFGLRFEILSSGLVDSLVAASVFDGHPLLIARMDQLARNADLLDQLSDTDWDLVVVDEAHRMGAHYFGAKLEKTKRFQLGELLGARTRHFLLMTATPHSGKDEDFQLFLSLLDADRFAGRFRRGVHGDDTTGVMRRMIKEDLLTFEGKPLFPERVAQTVPYELTAAESELYDLVTQYVREGMNRAERLDAKRRNTVGFALTVLQRRLASSPEAIYQSLLRRSERLRRRRHELLTGGPTGDAGLLRDGETLDDPDEYSVEEIEQVEEELVDAATAAQTLAELDAELLELADLTATAKRVRDTGEDRKWVELRQILDGHALGSSPSGSPRKIIIFTEHRDTLTYLTDKIRLVLGRAQAVEAIHGGVQRIQRRQITEEFTKNPDCRVLLATDAAGEGLNLQVAHLMVNYDLPWNPNRIEQRFGRIHRIGQTEVCRLWNLVASNTREGEVFTRLLHKIEEQRQAYGGKVFDVLGLAFSETPLRQLLVEAIRYGEQPEIRARMHRVIDDQVADGVKEMLADHALAHDALAEADIAELRRQMDDARARRLQPHYIEWAFRNGFSRLGGRMAKRERGRFEISNVPAGIRASTRRGPIPTRYERVTFDVAAIEPPDDVRADLLAPGHPLHDAVAEQTILQCGQALARGTVLVSPTVDRPVLLVGVIEEIIDATEAPIARRFGYAYVEADGTVTPAGPAPYLDCVSAPTTPAIDNARALPWLADAEARATSWVVSTQLPAYLAEIGPRRLADLGRTRDHVTTRLNHEINRLAGEALQADEQTQRGTKPRESAESLTRKAADLETRLERRLHELDRQAHLSPRPPRVLTAALVLPLSSVEDELPEDAPIHARETKEVERRGVDLVMSTERTLGRRPTEQPFNNPGFDILSETSDRPPIRIEVKARIDGADDFFVTHNEIVLGRNAAPHYRLAMVRVDPRGPQHDQVRYLNDPFQNVEIGGFPTTGIRAEWGRNWASGRPPF